MFPPQLGSDLSFFGKTSSQDKPACPSAFKHESDRIDNIREGCVSSLADTPNAGNKSQIECCDLNLDPLQELSPCMLLEATSCSLQT